MMTICLMPASIASKAASGAKASGTVMTAPSTFRLRGDLANRVVDRNAVDLAAALAGRDAADDLGAVLETLAGEVERLAPGDSLHDELEILVNDDAHGGSSAPDLLDRALRRLADRDGAIAVVDAVLLQDLERVRFPRSGNAEDGDLLGRARSPDSMTPLMTPRATRSARVFETTFDMTAIFSTPGLERTSLVSRSRLLHARVAADARRSSPAGRRACAPRR